MSKLERLLKQKQELTQNYQRQKQQLEDQILKERERIRRNKEAEKRKKEQQAKQAQQNIPTGTDSAYQSFVKDSMTIAEANKILDKLLKEG